MLTLNIPDTKKNYSTLLCAGLIIVLFSGCATASIESGESNSVKGPYDRIFILISGSPRADKFIEGFAEKIKYAISERNTNVEVYVEERLSLETQKDIDDKINAHKSDAVMIIKQTEALIDGRYGFGTGRGSMAGTFDLRLFEKAQKRPVWRANMKAYGEYGISMSIEKTVKKFIALLEQDKILRRINN